MNRINLFMKRLLLIFLLVCCNLSGKTNNIYFEAGMISPLLSLNYEKEVVQFNNHIIRIGYGYIPISGISNILAKTDGFKSFKLLNSDKEYKDLYSLVSNINTFTFGYHLPKKFNFVKSDIGIGFTHMRIKMGKFFTDYYNMMKVNGKIHFPTDEFGVNIFYISLGLNMGRNSGFNSRIGLSLHGTRLSLAGTEYNHFGED